MFHSQDIPAFVFLTMPWFTKSVMPWWVLEHETKSIFEYVFWATTYKVTKLGRLIDISKNNNFLESFEQLGELWLGSKSFWIWRPAPIT